VVSRYDRSWSIEIWLAGHSGELAMKQSAGAVRLGAVVGILGPAAVVAIIAASVVSVVDVAAQSETDEQAMRRARVGGSVPVESDLIGGLRRFEPNNRTYWHSHAGGFILFVQEGRARVQTRGQPMRELGPGEIDYTPPGVEHWHGSAPDEPLLQLGIVPYGGGIEFLEPVTDAQYNGESL
jgi:quercetin dioxygenase-like cupin family protein